MIAFNQLATAWFSKSHQSTTSSANWEQSFVTTFERVSESSVFFIVVDVQQTIIADVAHDIIGMVAACDDIPIRHDIYHKPRSDTSFIAE